MVRKRKPGNRILSHREGGFHPETSSVEKISQLSEGNPEISNRLIGLKGACCQRLARKAFPHEDTTYAQGQACVIASKQPRHYESQSILRIHSRQALAILDGDS